MSMCDCRECRKYGTTECGTCTTVIGQTPKCFEDATLKFDRCKHCGGKARDSYDGFGHYVRCIECGVRTPSDTSDNARAMWNRGPNSTNTRSPMTPSEAYAQLHACADDLRDISDVMKNILNEFCVGSRPESISSLLEIIRKSIDIDRSAVMGLASDIFSL